MVCVIQEEKVNKKNPYGAFPTLEVYEVTDKEITWWYYRYAGKRFARTRTERYKISIEHGKRKRHITTINFYDMVLFGFRDYVDNQEMVLLAPVLGLDLQELYALIEEKTTPLRERLSAEFYATEEGKTCTEHQRVIRAHTEAQATFCARYRVSQMEYNRCYDVYGVLRNPSYLAKLQEASGTL